VQADLRDWQLETEGWDLIDSIFCHLPPDIRPHVYRRVVKGLAKNGLFILEAYTPSQIARGTGSTIVAGCNEETDSRIDRGNRSPTKRL
jgi:hypothetical protein